MVLAVGLLGAGVWVVLWATSETNEIKICKNIQYDLRKNMLLTSSQFISFSCIYIHLFLGLLKNEKDWQHFDITSPVGYYIKFKLLSTSENNPHDNVIIAAT